MEFEPSKRRHRGPAIESEVEGTEGQRIEGLSTESEIREALSSSWATINANYPAVHDGRGRGEYADTC